MQVKNIRKCILRKRWICGNYTERKLAQTNDKIQCLLIRQIISKFEVIL